MDRRRRRARLAGLAVLLAAGCLARPAAADRVVPKKGPPLRGSVLKTDTEVVVNKYRSTRPEMTYGVTRLPLDQVRRIEEEVDPDEVVRRRADALAPDDAAGRVALAKYAIGQKRKPEAARLLEEALALRPDDPEALALYGGKDKFLAERRGNPALDADLRAELERWLANEDGAARAKEAKRIEAERGFPARAEVLERMWRSRREPRGLRQDVALTLRSDKSPGAVFTIYVPPEYDPTVPTPLLLALHGGGRGGRDGDAVVGNGRDASTLYIRSVENLRWILVCPTALAAPWSSPQNEPWLLALLEEVEARFNVDLDRVYLTGHSMGGFGTWWFGPRHTDLFAAIAPTAGGGASGFKALKDAHTGVYVYHSADDPVVSVTPVRPAADALLEAGADVVYLELPDRGHSYPPEAEAEMFAFLRLKRLRDTRRASAWPRSSFARKPSADEVRYLGDPAAAWTAPAAAAGAATASLRELLADLERGGGSAGRAAAAIAAAKPDGAAKAVARVLDDPKGSEDVRAYAARCLGDLGDPAGANALAKVVASDAPARLVREAAAALGKLRVATTADALAKGLATWVAAYDRARSSGGVEFPDWEAVCDTLAELVEGYAACAPVATASAVVVERAAVRGVLERRDPVRALARAGQDASRPRARLARAVGRAYGALQAGDALVRALEASVRGDDAAGAAVRAGLADPVERADPP